MKTASGSDPGPSHGPVYAGLVLTMVFWGSAFPTSKMLVLEVPPEVGATLRFGIGSLLMMAMLFRRSAKPVADRDVCLRLVSVGLVGATGFNILFFRGLAIGSETWGSILGPTNHCGVTRLRPTHGRVSRYGAMTLCWTLDKLGPLSLPADDSGLVLDAIAGSDPLDPAASSRPFWYDPAPIRGPFKFGIIRNVAGEADEAMRSNFEIALQTLSKVGTIEEVSIPGLPYDEIARTILFAEMSSAFEDFIEEGGTAQLTAPEDRYTPYTRMVVFARDYIRALRLREVVVREIDKVFTRFDALVGPSRPTCSPKLGEDFPSALRGAAKDTMGAIGNLAGLPAISAPSGFSAEGLPTGIQFLGACCIPSASVRSTRTQGLHR